MNRREFFSVALGGLAVNALGGCFKRTAESAGSSTPVSASGLRVRESTRPELILIRHGETAWSEAGRLTGLADIPLSPQGEQQARALCEWTSRRTIARTLVSPLVRARRTAELAGLLARDIVIDPNLREWDYGAYDGRLYRDVVRERPAWDIWKDGVPPGAERPGETAEQVAARCDEVLARIGALLAERKGDVVVVAHGHVLRLLTARWLGQVASFGARLRIDPAHVSILGLENQVAIIRQWNIQTAMFEGAATKGRA